MGTVATTGRRDAGLRMRPLRADEVFVVAGLVRTAAPACAPMAPRDVLEHLDGFEVVADRRDRIVASAGLWALPDGRLELRGLVVAPRWRGRGLGRRLAGRAAARAARRRRALVCVTRSPGFFEQLGFQRIPLAGVPPKPLAAHGSDGERPRVALARPARPAAATRGAIA